MIGDLDEPAEVNLIAYPLLPDLVGPFPKERQSIFPSLAKPGLDLISLQVIFFHSSFPSPSSTRNPTPFETLQASGHYSCPPALTDTKSGAKK
jgi:hypothetical protein